MIRFLKSLVLLPVAIVVVLLAVANRESVRLSLDPFSPEPVFAFSMPVYVLVFAAVALGIVVGGIGAWLGQGDVRARARHHRRERERLEREVAQSSIYVPSVGNGGSYAGAGSQTALPAPR